MTRTDLRRRLNDRTARDDEVADGHEVDSLRKPGDVAWRDALEHKTENIGAKTAVEIQIEMK